MKKLIISTVQSNLFWESIDANLAQFAKKIAFLKDRTDVIILPEMFTTGFTNNNAALSEVPEGKTFIWLQQQAKLLNAVITGSYIVKEHEKYYNRLVWMQPNGAYAIYNKHQLFTMAKEHLSYEAGITKTIIEYKGWKICPLICYDLRFPVWSRNVEDYDLLFYVASWPHKRAAHWKALLKARAIENQVYTIGVNRVGKDGNDLYYTGDTSVISYDGTVFYQAAHAEDIFTIQLDLEQQLTYRKKLAFLPDRDVFQFTQ